MSLVPGAIPSPAHKLSRMAVAGPSSLPQTLRFGDAQRSSSDCSPSSGEGGSHFVDLGANHVSTFCDPRERRQFTPRFLSQSFTATCPWEGHLHWSGSDPSAPEQSPRSPCSSLLAAEGRTGQPKALLATRPGYCGATSSSGTERDVLPPSAGSGPLLCFPAHGGIVWPLGCLLSGAVQSQGRGHGPPLPPVHVL